MQPCRFPEVCELAASAVPTGSRFRRCRIGSECVAADGGARKSRQPHTSHTGVPLRRPGGDSDDHKTVREARDAAHDAVRIASPPRATHESPSPSYALSCRHCRFDRVWPDFGALTRVEGAGREARRCRQGLAALATRASVGRRRFPALTRRRRS